MNSTILSTLLPILLLFLLGYALRKGKFCPPEFFSGLNRLAFWVLLPCQLFMEVVRAPGGVDRALLGPAMLLAAACVIVPAIGFVAHRLLCHKADVGVFLQGTMRGNLVYVGLPVVLFCFDKPGDELVRQSAVLSIALIIPVYNVMSVLLLNLSASRRDKPFSQRLIGTLRGVATNPLIIACVAGFVFKGFGWMPPLFAARVFDGLAKASLAVALLALGGSFTLSRIHASLFRAALVSAIFRVAVNPLAGLLLGMLFAPWLRLDAGLFLAALLLLATPTAVASFVMADQMGCDKDLAAAIVVLTTLLSFPALALILLFH